MRNGSAPADEGFDQTCWRGICLNHPADWEPAGLSEAGQPGEIIFVDRRFQRLQVEWKVLRQTPDLARTYEELKRKAVGDAPVAPLTGAPGWTGLVRKETQGLLVHAGRYFAERGLLVQVVIIWPGQRDQAVERAMLESIAPPEQGPTVRWAALGLSADVPAEFELTTSSSLVGRVVWEFQQAGRPPAHLGIARIATPESWLKQALVDWLTGQSPEGFRPSAKAAREIGGHAGAEVFSRRGGWMADRAGRAVRRTDWAWRCTPMNRVYHVWCWRRSRTEIDWPQGLQVHCCRTVMLPPVTR